MPVQTAVSSAARAVEPRPTISHMIVNDRAGPAGRPDANQNGRSLPPVAKYRVKPDRETVGSMPEITTKPRTKVKPQTERPKLYKVILINDDFTPREFVVTVLKGEFKLSEDQAHRIMITAHRRGVCVVAVFTKDVAETKATRATDAGKAKGYPLLFTTEPEE